MLRHMSPTILPSTVASASAALQEDLHYPQNAKMGDSNVLVYLLRRDLRVSDNPILHSLSTRTDHGFTHLLPLYVYAAQQIEVSGFIEDKGAKSPYPEARSQVGGFWRCGEHRARFLSECVWDMKDGLEKSGSGLCIRVGLVGEVIARILEAQGGGMKIGAIWMTSEEGFEEEREERAVKRICERNGLEFKIWVDEKYLVDDRDLPFEHPHELPDVYTTYRKSVEPLREKPRPVLPTPQPGSLPPFPEISLITPQHAPFDIPDSLSGIQTALLKPLRAAPLCKNPPSFPPNTQSIHPFKGGESRAQTRLSHLLSSGAMTTYLSTRNGLLGTDFSSKLSAYLAQGCLTARQIHAALLAFEDGTDPGSADAPGYGKGENEGTKHMRFELLWRDYMRLCTRKFGARLFKLEGFKQEEGVEARWTHPNRPREGQTKDEVQEIIERFLNGTTGMGLIDASSREVYLTGYTSNRARQNVASFLSKHLYIDWRIGAEWYECMLVDYDLSSNWGNWQYVAGVGNDPRGEARIFNPVKQAFDYDPGGEYVKAWVPETRDLKTPGEVFQAWTVKDEGVKQEMGLAGLLWVERPLKKIEFTVGRRGGRGRGGMGGGGSRPRSGDSGSGGLGRSQPTTGQNPTGQYAGRGYGSSRGYIRGYAPRGRGTWGGGGRAVRTGMMDKHRAAEGEMSEQS